MPGEFLSPSLSLCPTPSSYLQGVLVDGVVVPRGELADQIARVDLCRRLALAYRGRVGWVWVAVSGDVHTTVVRVEAEVIVEVLMVG